MVCNEKRLGSNLIKAMKSDQIAHRQIKRTQSFLKVASRLNPVLSAHWKWYICRIKSLEVQQSMWDWSKGVTMCFCLTAFQDWMLHFLFESYFFLDCCWKMKRGWEGVDRHASTLTGRVWFFCETKGFCSILIPYFFPRENINNNSTLHVLIVIQQKQTTENRRVQS